MSDEATRELLAAFQRACVGQAIDPADAARLESATGARLGLYRDLVRVRLRDLVTSAFPRTTAALGKAKTIALADRHVTSEPPAVRFFREHAAAFGRWALPVLEEAPDPPFVVDLLRLEAAQWQANYTMEATHDDLVELDLEGIAVPSATLVTLRTRFAVHRAEPAVPEEGTFRLAVYRRPDHRVETRWMEPIWADLLDAMILGERPAIDCVRDVLRAHGRAADAAFVDEMTTLLSTLATNGALLGSRPGPTT